MFFIVKKQKIKILKNNIIKYGEGICFEKKEKTTRRGVRNQNKFFFNKIAKENEYKAIMQK